MNPPEQPLRPDRTSTPAWERRLDAELRQLPELAAPADLLPNVMALVRARETLRARVWWRRPATMWHPALRMMFAVIAAAVLAGLIVGGQLLWPEVEGSSVMGTFSALGAKLSALWSAGHTVVNAIGTAFGAMLTPMRLAILGAILVSQLVVFGAGSAAMRAMLQPRRATI
jgi:hypothetical protein